jgi:hypothetical protein
MWIVRVALDRPYTSIVLAVLILVLSPVMILRTPTDIFPNIYIPVIAVAWQFVAILESAFRFKCLCRGTPMTDELSLVSTKSIKRIG